MCDPPNGFTSMTLIETQLARFFVRVAHARSLSRAALELSTTQSNVTTKIRQLEEQVGRQLLRRHSRGVELTPEGVALLPYCEELIRVAEAAQNAAMGAGRARPMLRLGVIHTAASHLMPDVIARFAAANRGVHLRVVVGSTEELRTMVTEGQLDVAVIAGVGVEATVQAHCRVEDTMGWAMKRGILKRPHADLMVELSTLPIYATKRGASYEASIRQLFQDAGLSASMPLFQELGTTDILRSVLMLGQGYTFVSKRVFEEEIAQGLFDFYPVPNQLPRLHPTLVTRAGTPRAAIVDAFVRHFEREAGAVR